MSGANIGNETKRAGATALFIRRPVLATMLSVALVLFGVLGYRELSVREFPDVDPPIVSVQTTLRGANPRVMESAVTDVLEEELSSVEGLRTMTSSSAEFSSPTTVGENTTSPKPSWTSATLACTVSSSQLCEYPMAATSRITGNRASVS